MIPRYNFTFGYENYVCVIELSWLVFFDNILYPYIVGVTSDWCDASTLLLLSLAYRAHSWIFSLLYVFNKDEKIAINFRSGRESDSDAEVEHAEKLRQVRAVLEEVTELIKY